MADRIGQQLGNYRLLHLIGRGGFADVYLAEHVHLNTKVAIKVLQMRLVGSNLEQFRAEARTVAALAHPHIVRVLDFGVEEGIPFLVMDYAPNGTMRQRILKGVQFTPTSIAPYVKQVASALQYAHNKKLIHRDIKPENMLVGRHNGILLSDFGLVLITHSSDSENIQEMAGTVAYMAPEQLQGKPRPASDQYALGIVAYEWLSGARPFQGSFLEIASQHMLAPPAPLSERIPSLSQEVEQVVLKALEKDPHRRFASVQDFATAFERACQSQRLFPTTYPVVDSPLQQPSPVIDSANSASQPTQQNSVITSPSGSQSPKQGLSRRRVLVGTGLAVLGAGITWLGLSIFSAAPTLLHTDGNAPLTTSTPSTCPTTTSATPIPSAGSATPPPVTGTPATLTGGLQYIDIIIGCGPKVTPNSNVSVEYTFWLQSNGKKIASSYDRKGQPISISLGRGVVIPGFEKGIVGMKQGGIRRLIIPPALAYGAQGQPPQIPPNATLISDVTMLNVLPGG